MWRTAPLPLSAAFAALCLLAAGSSAAAQTPPPRTPTPPPAAAKPKETPLPPEVPESRVGRSMSLLKDRFQPCQDKPMQTLVGLDRDKALKKVRDMKLMQVRLMHWRQPVTYEVLPQRLTLVLNDSGQVLRALCR
jgi:hypothetical protein